ncbi:MAG: Calx-beta domain-containing protein [bacterium]|nr:Calx-beta domain-containing protein [bacterium]
MTKRTVSIIVGFALFIGLGFFVIGSSSPVSAADFATVGFEPPLVRTATETDGLETFDIEVDTTGFFLPVSSFNVRLNFSGTATLGEDYTTNTPTTFTCRAPATNVFPPNVAGFDCRFDLDIIIVNDTLFEPTPETIIIQLQSTSNSRVLVSSQRTITMTITDNDPGATVEVNMPNFVDSEDTAGNVPIQVRVVVQGPAGSVIPSPLRLDVAYSGTATNGVDYIGFADVFLNLGGGFPPGTYNYSLNLPVLSDSVHEGADETITATFSTTAPNVTFLNATDTVVILEDDLRTTLAFDSAAVTVPESVGSLDIPVSLLITDPNLVPARDYFLNFPITAALSYTGNATNGGLTADYIGLSSFECFPAAPPEVFPFGFAPEIRSCFVTIPIIDDTRVEGTETFTVTLVSNNPNVLIGAASTHTVTILENDVVSPLTLLQPVPGSTITTPYGNPTYEWTDTGAEGYEMAIFPRGGPYNQPRYYGTNISAANYCDGFSCVFEPTTQPTANERARLVNGQWEIWLRPGGGEWRGPFYLTLNAPPLDPVTMNPASNLNTLRPTFNWSLFGNAANATTFTLYVVVKADFDAGNATPAYQAVHPRVETCGGAAGTTCSLRSPVNLRDDTEYYVFILASGPGGASVGGTYNNGWAGITFRVDLNPGPPIPNGIKVNINQGRPTIEWNTDPSATRHTVAIYNNTTNSWAYGRTHNKTGDAQLTCSATLQTCRLTTADTVFTNGSYSVYVNAEGAGGASSGGAFGNGYGGPENFTLNFPAPALVTNLTATANGTNVTISFTGVAGATWYRVWLGTANAAQTYFYEWRSSTALGCENIGTCQGVITLPAALPAGSTYYLAVQSAGPGGFSTGGLTGNGFAVSNGFTAP